MHYIFLLLFTLIFTACNPATVKDSLSPTETSPAPSPVALPVSNQDTDMNDLKILDEDSIVGNYVLKRGFFRNQEITEGYLVVEEIDVDNYGYYYVTIANTLTPETHTGIFYKKGGEYVQKVIEDSTEAEIRQGKKKSKMSIIDNIKLTQENDLLKLNIDSDKKEKLIWERDDNEAEKSEKMRKTLESAKSEYRLYYKDKCKDCEEFCGSAEYTKINDN